MTRTLAPCVIVLLAASGAVPGLAVAAPKPAVPQASFPPAMTQAAVAAWLPTVSTLSLDTVVGVGAGRIVAISGQQPAMSPPGAIEVNVRTEIIDPAAAKSSNALSEAQQFTVDCDMGQVRAGPINLYPQRDLQGAPRQGPGILTWTNAAPQSLLGRIVEAACGPVSVPEEPTAPSWLDQPGKIPSPAAAAPAPAPPVSAAPPPVQAAPPPAPKPAPLKPTVMPAPVAPAIAAPPAAPARPATAPVAPPAPPPVPAPRPAPPPPPPAPESKPVQAAPRPGKTLGNLYVQIAAFPTREAAEAALSALRDRAPGLIALHPSSIETSSADGIVFHRALLSGFRSVGEAKALCDQLSALAPACTLRLR